MPCSKKLHQPTRNHNNCSVVYLPERYKTSEVDLTSTNDQLLLQMSTSAILKRSINLGSFKKLKTKRCHFKLSKEVQFAPHSSQAVQLSLKDNIRTESKHVEVQHPSWTTSLRLSLRWLRDHCQCASCKDPETGFRLLDTHNPLLLPQHVHKASSDTAGIQVNWVDGHVSTFPYSWLWDNCFEGQSKDLHQGAKTLWNAEKAKSIPFAKLQYEDFMTSDDAVKTFLQSILNYGIALVQQTPVTEGHTRQLMERLGPIWQTFWGEVYYVVADLEKHSHPSYTGVELGFHTDTNYYFEGAGLQAFHVMEHDGTGGINRFVDGFQVAKIIKDYHPDAYEYLSTVPVSFKYIEKNLHLVNEDTLFKHDPITKELIQFRYTPYDFDVFRTVQPMDVGRFYKSLDILTKEIYNQSNWHWIHLKPGTVLVTDNWRVLHGRSPFTGKRNLCGMYVSRSDFLSRARRLGLL